MLANGMLAGLVAITAPCAFVDPISSAIIGTVAGLLVVLAISFVENKLKVDDPVGAIAVHGVNGSFGVLAVGLFANGKYGAGWNATTEGKGANLSGVTGIFHSFGDGIGQLGAQAIGVVVLWTVMFGLAFAWFKFSNLITPIRSKEEDELVGLDLPEMGVLAYPEFTGHGGFN
jgi:Amt family ammonium transporter